MDAEPEELADDPRGARGVVARGGRLWRRRRRTAAARPATTALEGTITISGSSTVQPITSLVAELFNEDVIGRRRVHRRRSRHERRLRPVLRRRDGHPGCLPPDRGGGDRRLFGERRRVHRAGRRVRRHHGHDQSGECRRDVPEPRRPLRALRSRVRRHRHLGRRRRAGQRGRRNGWVPERPARDHRPGRGVGDLRLVHRSLAGSRTSPSSRGFRRTRPRRCAPTTRPLPTTT